MRLAEFILANTEPILTDWEVFARSIWPGMVATNPATLRDHAEEILRAAVSDMTSAQTAAEQSEKSKGEGHAGADSDRMDAASRRHGALREASGFDLAEVVAEYRALRASVLRLWRASAPSPDLRDLDDLTRFNESIDESLTEAVESYTQQAERDRALMANEQAARAGAETANRAKDIFLATLSHEMRTPLNAIVGWLAILRAKGCQEEDLAEGLDVIERNTMAQSKLIEDILDVSRIVSGKLRLERHPCDLADVVTTGVNAVRPAAEVRGVALDVRLAPSAGRVSCDPARILQVVDNLLSNAIKFTPRDGTVSVTLAREGSGVRLDVSDTGQGISPDFLPHVFDRFRQADGSTRRHYAGLGLGLSIVKSLVELHGGTVEVHSAGKGHGSIFTVRLPVRAVRSEESGAERAIMQDEGDSAVPGSPMVRLDGLRVLVADDEADARRLLVKLLEGVGATVTAVGSVREAIAALPESRPDVLVSDIGMPGEDGFDLIRQVRASGHHAKELPAVALTAFVHKDHERNALLAGFQVYIPKPVDPHHLTVVIASLAGRTG